MKIHYEPKDVYCKIIDSEHRSLVYGYVSEKSEFKECVQEWYGPGPGVKDMGVAKALVLKILNEEEDHSAYCFFGKGRSTIYARDLMKAVIKDLELEEHFIFSGGSSEILCIKNSCSIRFFYPSNLHKIRVFDNLKTVWMHVWDDFSKDEYSIVNQCARNADSKMVFTFSTNLCSKFIDGWFYKDFLQKLPEDAVSILLK